MRPSKLRRMILPAVAAMAAVMTATASAAQVIEIDSNGAATTYDAPAVYTSEGVRSLTTGRSQPAMTASSAELNLAIATAANRHALDPKVLQAVAWTESRFRQTAVSPKGAVGVMQLMDGTARILGVNRYDLADNIEGGAVYLNQMLGRYRGDLSLALAAYNAGPGAVDRYGGIPPFSETRSYVRMVLDRAGAPGPLTVTQIAYPSVILIAP